jgi:hypothetical protein
VRVSKLEAGNNPPPLQLHFYRRINVEAGRVRRRVLLARRQRVVVRVVVIARLQCAGGAPCVTAELPAREDAAIAIPWSTDEIEIRGSTVRVPPAMSQESGKDGLGRLV